MNRVTTDDAPDGPVRQGHRRPALRWLVFPACALIVWLLYLPVAGHYFVSDDFKVLRRVCLNRQILITGFFRPLSDLTILGNYLLAGFTPRVFNGFNLLIHAATGTLLFFFAVRFYRRGRHTTGVRSSVFFAGVSTLLFLTYPFHSEAVVWLLGRGASMAAMFSLAAMCICQRQKSVSGTVTASLCYFLALLAFESALVLPIILLILLRKEHRPLKEQMRWLFALGITLTLHLIIRRILSGSLTGSYGEGFVPDNIVAVAGNVFRVTARLFLPPVQSPLLFTLLAAGLTITVSLMLFSVFRKRGHTAPGRSTRVVLPIVLMGLAASLIPFLTSVSIHTSESDRMLYLPSVFLCLLGGTVMEKLSRNTRSGPILIVVITGLQIFFLEQGNRRWKEAGAITSGLVQKAVPAGSDSSAFFIAVPDNIEGAYVFRQGFTDALVLNGRDSVKNKASFQAANTGNPATMESTIGSGNRFAWNPAEGQWMLVKPGPVPGRDSLP